MNTTQLVPKGGSSLGVSVGFRVPRNGNLLENSFLRVFEHAVVFRRISSFMVRKVTMGSQVPVNENSHRIPSSCEQEPAPSSQEPGIIPKFLLLAIWNRVPYS